MNVFDVYKDKKKVLSNVTASEAIKQLGIDSTPRSVGRYAHLGYTISGYKFVITKSTTTDARIPQELLDEFDNITAKFREYFGLGSEVHNEDNE